MKNCARCGKEEKNSNKKTDAPTTNGEEYAIVLKSLFQWPIVIKEKMDGINENNKYSNKK